MSLFLPTWISAIATIGLLIGAGLTVYFARKAFNAQSQQLKDQMDLSTRQTVVLDLQAKDLQASLVAREEAATQLRLAYAATVAAWLDEPLAARVGWRVGGHVQNTGERPVRNVSVCWYDGESLILERVELASCLLGHGQKDFDCCVDSDVIGAGRLKAVVRFRTVGDDWWNVGTDGHLTETTG